MISCILTIIKNEHEYLDEWIRHHLNIGIEHIFIFEDIDSESHKNITDKYKQVSLQNILDVFTENEKEQIISVKNDHNKITQFNYIRKGLSYIKKRYDYDWCFVIDADEYIALEKDNLQNILSLYKEHDAFVMQWECYGANGLIYKPDYKQKGLQDTYTKKIEGCVPDKYVNLNKTCYNLRTYKESFFSTPHWPTHSCKWCRTDLSRKRLTPIYDNIYIKHYITKSWEEYLWKRQTRGFLNGATRTIDFFFKINPDMIDKKDELLKQLESNKTLVILPYKEEGSQGSELRITLNAWKKFCRFDYHFIVIGTFSLSLVEEFPWVEFIISPQPPKIQEQYNQHLDVQHCMEYVMNNYKEYKGFIWIADDNYAIKPFNLEDIMTIHYHSSSFFGIKEKPTNFWKHDKWKTRQLLDREQLPHYNYTTHYPCWLEFDKLKEIWDKFDMRNESYVLEDVYYNYFSHPKPIIDSSIRLGIWSRQIYMNQFHQSIQDPNIKFICNSVEGWSKELEDDLWKIIK